MKKIDAITTKKLMSKAFTEKRVAHKSKTLSQKRDEQQEELME